MRSSCSFDADPDGRTNPAILFGDICKTSVSAENRRQITIICAINALAHPDIAINAALDHLICPWILARTWLNLSSAQSKQAQPISQSFISRKKPDTLS
ncbi:hypothetical protein [Luteimonas sp. e5]